MTAPDQCCINVKKLLPIRRRPHMTHKQHMQRVADVCLGRLLPFCHRHVRFDRVCNETILMCSVVHLIEFFCIGSSVSAPRDLRA